jgi:flagellar biosynthesis/type III secretory pathway protein FliH
MKSLSKLSSRLSHEQIKPWNISELEIEPAESPKEIDQEQILALFGNGDEARLSDENNGPRSMLHRAGTNLLLTNWQPREIDFQPSLELDKEWLLAEEPTGLFENSEKGIWEETNFETESVTSLKQARAQAEEILLEARTTADRLILQAQDGVEQAKKNGYQQGLDSAYCDMQESLKSVHAMIDEVQKWQAELMAQGEQTIIDMLKEIAQTMFGEGVQLDANALQINLNRIMENSQRLGDLNIFLNPRDANLLDPSWKEYQSLISGNKVRMIASENITPGGCIVKGITGMVDGRVETQLTAVLNAFDELREAT